MMEPASSKRQSPVEPELYAFGSFSYPWFVVGLLAALQFISNLERQILSLAIEPLQRDLAISDVQYSLLQGFAFALFYALVAVPAGWLADRWRRNWILAISMLLWALATTACMLARSYHQLFLARMLIGLADAALLPASFSLLSDYFPRDKLAGAIGTITGASFLGTGVSLTSGGFLLGRLPADAIVDLAGIGHTHGWQLVFGIVAAPGLLLALAVATLREPSRRQPAASGRSSAEKRAEPDLMSILLRDRGTVVALIGGIVFMAAFQYGLTNWAVALFIRKFGWTAAQIGLPYGLYFMIIGTLASLAGGRLCDWLRAKGRADANFLIPFVATFLLLPAGLAFALVPSSMISATLLGVITFLVVLSFGPAMAAIPILVPATSRARLTALTLLLSTLLGSGGGPWLVATLTDDFFEDPAALPLSLAICTPLLIIPMALCFFAAMRAVKDGRTGGDGRSLRDGAAMA